MRTAILVSGAFIALSTTCLPQPPGPAAHWRLDETSGTTVADSSPNQNDGTLGGFSGTPWGPGVHGNALTFDGIDDRVLCAQNGGIPVFDGLGSPYAITAWVNGPAQNDDRFYCEGSTSNNSPLFSLGTGRTSNGTADRFQLFIRNDLGATIVNQQSATTVFDGTWHHVAVVDLNGAVTVYVDGVPDPQDFSYALWGSWPGIDRVALGAVVRATACCFFTGSLDDVRVFPFLLSAADILTIMNDGPLVPAFQVNRAAASFDIDGVAGSHFSAARPVVAQGGGFTMTLATDQGGQPWELVADAGNAVPNGLVTPANIVNLNLASPTLTFVNGFFGSPFGVAPPLPGVGGGGASVTSTLTLVAPSSPLTTAAQFAMIDPTSPDGFSTSAPVELVVQ